MSYGASVPKLNDNLPNEDSFRKSENLIAVSDGAGGCGLFAGEWSEYLLRHIPRKRAITSFQEFDTWVDGIWEEFYDRYELVAKAGDGIFLNKFYNEGSCATVAAVWRVSADRCCWLAYGDSVAFKYDVKSGILEHSFTRLADFSRPPMLVSCKDPLIEDGLRLGDFKIDDDSVVFVASDALSHYVLMMYELANCGRYWDDLKEESRLQSSNSALLHTAETMRFDFCEDVLSPLRESAKKHSSFKSHIRSLLNQGLLDLDDTTVVFLD